ncbi:hypothetical protein FNH22_15430 [Fulvivirga sp. M361]|nr:hypothetical protein FNH22_15430 [Fulvivirga sp. M361]
MLKLDLYKPDIHLIKLVLLWFVVVACVFLRVISQPDRYTSPDSYAYLHKAEKISDHQEG